VKLGCPTVKDLINRFRWQLKFHDVELSQYIQTLYFSILLGAFHGNVYASVIFGMTKYSTLDGTDCGEVNLIFYM
jgi:hypothetical protein